MGIDDGPKKMRPFGMEGKWEGDIKRKSGTAGNKTRKDWEKGEGPLSRGILLWRMLFLKQHYIFETHSEINIFCLSCKKSIKFCNYFVQKLIFLYFDQYH